MNPQFIVDGLLGGAMIGLGAIGVTLTYSILRFANFAHGELISWGAYGTLLIAGAIGALANGPIEPLGPFSFGWSIVLASLLAMALTGCLALALDLVLFRRLRLRGNAIVVVMASFGASMALRSLLEFLFTSKPAYYSRSLQMARPIAFGIQVTPDQLALIAATSVLLVAVHLLLTRTQIGRAMPPLSENP